MNPDHSQSIVELLEELNRQVAKQNSLGRMFWIGIIYGIGFFVGSAIIATIALGVFGPWFAEISWIRGAFETGASLLPR
ncbi:hypothetical protein A3G63_01485 [Candidatus Kaiserbacteria bacterium RIFCSPLOWO2_12_FULL_52_8]|uniref:Uncharacterized protein n=1 Tax=Candidatus Kaiserbacteria bacterium RIFCSPHIGHO2_01_FULL_53_31 TaxID=1798481 RepID=A0A1F6CH69_9BACT|nr:MAG: hypothetical protein A2678_03245 [Candidatus Kaiserbacteria bacterium RIFCSPHIGHO2_01_FULL_53_31]OGG93456.1 MAG: hypothetical protein A3G63_01485 [Candidatus Kaiserbacteria bacterium RIFCSPLOWO2_12_FULL_52_8]